MPMSPEARQAASERMKARHAEKRVAELPGEAEYAVMAPNGLPAEAAPADGADTMSRTELFRARMAAQGPVRTHEDLASVAGEAGEFDRSTQTPGVEHTSAGLVWLYKHEDWGWERRRFSRNGISELLVAGLLPYCGDCGSASCVGAPNACPKGRMYMFRVCPVPGCNRNNGGPRKFYDIGMQAVETAAEEDNPFAIRDNVYSDSTPESRTQTQLDDHIRAYHEQEARHRGLGTLAAPTQPRALVP